MDRKTLTQYQTMYKLMNEGAFNDIFRDAETFEEVGRISVKKLKKECRRRNIDFDNFLAYAQKERRKRMPKINQEEYEILKELDTSWEWIARGEGGTLFIFSGASPTKANGTWTERWGRGFWFDNYRNHFQFIRWPDKEAYSITELIEEYETRDFNKYESEET